MFGLMPRSEARPFAMMRREFDTLFDRLFGSWPLVDMPKLLDYPLWGLIMEETDKEVVVRAEAPGFEVGDFEVQLTGDLLLITAAHKPVKGKEGNGEVRTVEMKRYVTVPPGIDPATWRRFIATAFWKSTCRRPRKLPDDASRSRSDRDSHRDSQEPGCVDPLPGGKRYPGLELMKPSSGA